jgi:hypothetical protein
MMGIRVQKAGLKFHPFPYPVWAATMERARKFETMQQTRLYASRRTWNVNKAGSRWKIKASATKRMGNKLESVYPRNNGH